MAVVRGKRAGNRKGCPYLAKPMSAAIAPARMNL